MPRHGSKKHHPLNHHTDMKIIARLVRQGFSVMHHANREDIANNPALVEPCLIGLKRVFNRFVSSSLGLEEMTMGGMMVESLYDNPLWSDRRWRGIIVNDGVDRLALLNVRPLDKTDLQAADEFVAVGTSHRAFEVLATMLILAV